VVARTSGRPDQRRQRELRLRLLNRREREVASGPGGPALVGWSAPAPLARGPP
jgi:hypothetical protein